MPVNMLHSNKRLYSFYADDWDKTEKPKAHIKPFQPFDDMDSAIEYAKKLIKKWKVESIRILNGAANEDVTVKDNLDDIDYNFTTEVNENDRTRTK